MADGAVETNTSRSLLAGWPFCAFWLDDNARPLLDHGVFGGLEITHAQFLGEVERLVGDLGLLVTLLALERKHRFAQYCRLQLDVGHNYNMIGLSTSMIAVLHERLGVVLVPDISDDALKGCLANDLAGGGRLDKIVVRRVVSIDSNVFGVPKRKGIMSAS